MKSQTDLPLCVGFGISTPDQVAMLRDHCDGVIVGSALVRLCADIGKKTVSEVAGEMGTLARSLVQALRSPA